MKLQTWRQETFGVEFGGLRLVVNVDLNQVSEEEERGCSRSISGAIVLAVSCSLVMIRNAKSMLVIAMDEHLHVYVYSTPPLPYLRNKYLLSSTPLKLYTYTYLTLLVQQKDFTTLAPCLAFPPGDYLRYLEVNHTL